MFHVVNSVPNNISTFYEFIGKNVSVAVCKTNRNNH